MTETTDCIVYNTAQKLWAVEHRSETVGCRTPLRNCGLKIVSQVDSVLTNRVQYIRVQSFNRIKFVCAFTAITVHKKEYLT